MASAAPSLRSKVWPRARLGDLAEHRLGKMLDKAKNKGIPRPYLRNPNIQWFDVDLSDLQEILVEESDVQKYELRRGDVLICEGGEAGRAALWKGEADGIIFQKACHRVRVLERKRCVKSWPRVKSLLIRFSLRFKIAYSPKPNRKNV